MLEILQTFSRAVLAVLSGAMLMFGTAFFADVIGGTGSAFEELKVMLNDPALRVILIVVMAVTAYIIGIVNVAGASVAFSWCVKTTQDDLLLISRIESLQQPQLLKETLELVNVKRTLIGFALPLAYFGLSLAIDAGQWPSSLAVPIISGVVLAMMAGLALVFAIRINRVLDAIATTLLAATPNEPTVTPRQAGYVGS